MEITLEAGELARCLASVKSVAPSRTTIPILNNVLIVADVGRVSITATDLDMQKRASVVCETITEGRITIPAGVLFGIAKAFPKAQLITIKVDSDRARVTSGRSKYDLRTLPAVDFPIMAESVDGSIAFEAPCAAIGSAIDAVKGMFDGNHVAPFYRGLWMLLDGGRLAFVAADGHRLARIFVGDDGVPPGLPAVQMTTAAVREIGTMLGEDGQAVFSVSKGRLSVVADGVHLIARTLASEVSDYNRVIRGAGGASVRVKAGDLAQAMGRLLIVYSGVETFTPGFALRTKGGNVEIIAGEDGADYGHEVIAADVGDLVHFTASAPYIAEMIGGWPPDAMLTIGAEPGRAILITSDDCPELTQIIMPMTMAKSVARDDHGDDIAA